MGRSSYFTSQAKEFTALVGMAGGGGGGGGEYTRRREGGRTDSKWRRLKIGISEKNLAKKENLQKCNGDGFSFQRSRCWGENKRSEKAISGEINGSSSPLLVDPKGEKKSVSLSFIADRRPKIRFLSSSSFAIREMEARVFFGDAGMGLNVLTTVRKKRGKLLCLCHNKTK